MAACCCTPAQVLIKRKKKGRTGETWEVVRARGHLDEVQELRKGGTKVVGACGASKGSGCVRGQQGQRRRSIAMSRPQVFLQWFLPPLTTLPLCM